MLMVEPLSEHQNEEEDDEIDCEESEEVQIEHGYEAIENDDPLGLQYVDHFDD